MTITLNGSAGVTTNSGAVYDGLQRLTPVTASGTSVVLTGIPSWARKVTVVGSQFSTSSSNDIIVKVGTSSGIVSTGYASSWANITGTNTTITNTSTTYFRGCILNAATDLANFIVVITNITSNTWVSSTIGTSYTSTTARATFGTGSVTLSGALDRVEISTTTGTDTFDAGTINVFYE